MTPGRASAEVVLPCTDLDATVEFFTGRLGFRLQAVFPADAPTVAVVAGHGLCVRLDRRASGDAGHLRVAAPPGSNWPLGEGALVAPNGTLVTVFDPEAATTVPPLVPAFALRKARGGAFVEGRARMQYRDLIPDRQGGRFIASHIRIPDGGAVADYVHHHAVRFQVICCVRGWVRVVYENRGPAITLREGDVVLQPPHLRHRVLECSRGLEVVEVSCPAEHETLVDHDLLLPSERLDADCARGGQRFVHHVAEGAAWSSWRAPGFEVRDSGVTRATDGLGSVRCVRSAGGAAWPAYAHGGELLFYFVCGGAATLRHDGQPDHELEAGDAFVVAPGHAFSLVDVSADARLLEVAVGGG